MHNWCRVAVVFWFLLLNPVIIALNFYSIYPKQLVYQWCALFCSFLFIDGLHSEPTAVSFSAGCNGAACDCIYAERCEWWALFNLNRPTKCIIYAGTAATNIKSMPIVNTIPTAISFDSFAKHQSTATTTADNTTKQWAPYQQSSNAYQATTHSHRSWYVLNSFVRLFVSRVLQYLECEMP